MSIADVFDVGEGDTVADAWLTTVNLLDMLEHAHRVDEDMYDFSQARDKIAKVYAVAEAHSMDSKSGSKCGCGLSDAEHAILKRKVMTFFKLQLSNLKRFIV